MCNRNRYCLRGRDYFPNQSICALVAVLGWGWLGASSVNAAPVTVNASVNLRLNSDDNPGMVFGAPTSDTGYSGIADMSAAQHSQVTEMMLRGRYLSTKYSNADLDNDVRFLFLKTALKGQRLNFVFDAKARKDTTLVTFKDLEQNADVVDGEPDSGADVDAGHTAQKRLGRTQYNYAPSLQYRLGMFSNLSISYHYQSLEHERSDAVQLSDFKDQSISLGGSSRLGLRHRLGMSYEAGRFEPDSGQATTDPITKRQGFAISYIFDISPASKLSNALGYRQYTEESSNGSGVSQRSNSSMSVSLKYSVNEPVDQWFMDIRREVKPSNAAEMLLVDVAGFDLRHRLSELSWARLRTTGWQEQALYVDSVYPEKRQLSAELIYGHSLSRQIHIEGSYRYRRRTEQGIAGVAESNAVFLNMIYNAERFIF